MTVHSAIWSPPKMLPRTSRRSMTRTPRERQQQEVDVEAAAHAVRHQHIGQVIAAPAVTAARQRLAGAVRAGTSATAHDSPNPTTAAPAISAHAVGGSSGQLVHSALPPAARCAQRHPGWPRFRHTAPGGANSRTSASGTATGGRSAARRSRGTSPDVRWTTNTQRPRPASLRGQAVLGLGGGGGVRTPELAEIVVSRCGCAARISSSLDAAGADAPCAVRRASG